jgi:hypothetical protein
MATVLQTFKCSNETETKRKRNGNETETKWKRNGNENRNESKWNGNKTKSKRKQNKNETETNANKTKAKRIHRASNRLQYYMLLQNSSMVHDLFYILPSFSTSSTVQISCSIHIMAIRFGEVWSALYNWIFDSMQLSTCSLCRQERFVTPTFIIDRFRCHRDVTVV